MVEIMIIGWMQQHCPSKICVGLCGAHMCVPQLCHRGTTGGIYFLWDEFCDGEHSDFCVSV